MKSKEANEYRLIASEIIVKLYDAKELAQLRLLLEHAKSAVESIETAKPTRK